MSPDLDEQLFEALKKAMSGRPADSTRVEGVDIERGVDADGNPALFVRLTLTEPPEGSETWPADDVVRLRRLVRDALLRMMSDEALHWYVSFDSKAAAT